MLRLKNTAQLRRYTRLKRGKPGTRRRKDERRATLQSLVKECDDLMSIAVRFRDQFRCRRCGEVCRTGAAHFIRRGNYAVRWDFDNVDWLCYGCHVIRFHRQGFGEEHAELKLKQLGSDGFAALMRRSEADVDLCIPFCQDAKARIQAKLKEYGIG